MIVQVVDEKNCKGCGVCLKVCPSKVFEIRAGKAFPINAKACIGCRMCEINCPNYAITLYFKQ
ncbi:MAG: 4Fe-4S binding protein [Nitrososphaeria archaeon]|nr:4Fe-4S binding protein [Nitrososphaeria archaeon]